MQTRLRARTCVDSLEPRVDILEGGINFLPHAGAKIERAVKDDVAHGEALAGDKFPALEQAVQPFEIVLHGGLHAGGSLRDEPHTVLENLRTFRETEPLVKEIPYPEARPAAATGAPRRAPRPWCRSAPGSDAFLRGTPRWQPFRRDSCRYPARAPATARQDFGRYMGDGDFPLSSDRSALRESLCPSRPGTSASRADWVQKNRTVAWRSLLGIFRDRVRSVGGLYNIAGASINPRLGVLRARENVR